jgi:hypothetical protein
VTECLRDDLEWRRSGDEVVVLDARASTYHLLNRTGADLWGKLADGATGPALSAHLVDAYGLTPEQAERDVADFLAGIRQRGLLSEL